MGIFGIFNDREIPIIFLKMIFKNQKFLKIKMSFTTIKNLTITPTPNFRVTDEFIEFTDKFNPENGNFRMKGFAELTLYQNNYERINGEDYIPSYLNTSYIHWGILGDKLTHLEPVDDYSVTSLEFLIREFFKPRGYKINGEVIVFNHKTNQCFAYGVKNNKIRHLKNKSEEYLELKEFLSNLIVTKDVSIAPRFSYELFTEYYGDISHKNLLTNLIRDVKNLGAIDTIEMLLPDF